ncbi:claudin-23 [Tympanuchus pallidicinctus]|uniref:claudin-23 n=1 Tax=Tympanuchus pallidicinctus TaxID=109042 RepID=UPI002286FE62|nr:claudin-23 [Tympanuchus pallidicinctus]
MLPAGCQLALPAACRLLPACTSSCSSQLPQPAQLTRHCCTRIPAFSNQKRQDSESHPGAHNPSMRTPAVMIVGLVLCPCGLVLTLTGTLTPNWRQVSLIPNQPSDLILEQGIWDLCRERQSSHDRLCGQEDELGYFKEVPVQVARGLMPSSLVLTVLGLVVAALGVRCWQKEPRHALAGASGLVLLLSGLLSLVPASWYTHELEVLPAPSDATLAVGYSLVLSYLGSCLEILGGVALTLSFHHCCKERRASKTPPSPVLEPGTRSITGFYSNPWDVLENERDGRRGRSTLPCDSDL